MLLQSHVLQQLSRQHPAALYHYCHYRYDCYFGHHDLFSEDPCLRPATGHYYYFAVVAVAVAALVCSAAVLRLLSTLLHLLDVNTKV